MAHARSLIESLAEPIGSNTKSSKFCPTGRQGDSSVNPDVRWGILVNTGSRFIEGHAKILAQLRLSTAGMVAYRPSYRPSIVPAHSPLPLGVAWFCEYNGRFELDCCGFHRHLSAGTSPDGVAAARTKPTTTIRDIDAYMGDSFWLSKTTAFARNPVIVCQIPLYKSHRIADHYDPW